MIGTGRNRQPMAKAIKRQKQTVSNKYDYNESGPDSVLYQHTGGRQTKLNEAEKDPYTVKQEQALRSSVAGLWLDPEEVTPLGGTEMGAFQVSRTTLRTLLKQAGF
ncbi:MAG: hypothetical protein U0401_21745 [Anaerolineae bacterium]